MIPIEKKQIQLIKIGQKQLGIDDEVYRAMLSERFGVESCTKLSQIQAAAFLRELRGFGFTVVRKRKKGKPVPRKKGNMVKLASRAQHEKVGALSRLITWRVEDGLTRWLFKRFSIERVRTAQEAFLAIEGLKKMFENQMKKNCGQYWHLLDWSNDAEVERYIEEHIK